MNTMGIAKLAASTLVLSTTMVGCSMDGGAQRPANVSDRQPNGNGAGAAQRATKAMSAHQVDKAVTFAEAAVAAEPRNADYRLLLGRAYLAAGRFQSAEQSFADTLTLDPERERAALNLALAQVGTGKLDAARSTLGDYRDKLPATDFGLALALAGDTEEAVRVLEFATRAPDATATTRQNLALAYALAGKWANARIMAVQDLTPDQADARIAQWAVLAKPQNGPDQVAALLGVKRATDSGLPVNLALTPVAAPIKAAAAEVAIPPVVPAAATPVEIAKAPEQPTVDTASTKATPAAAPTPVATVTATPLVQAAMIQPASAQPAPVKAQPVTPSAAVIRTILDGKYVVQLGAFATTNSAEHAWNSVSGRLGIADYEPVNGVVKARNANLIRLSIGGFATRDDAARMCVRIKQNGRTCFVRLQAGDAPARWVQRHDYRVAAR